MVRFAISEHKICAILFHVNHPIDYRFTPALGAYKSILFAATLGFAACWFMDENISNKHEAGCSRSNRRRIFYLHVILRKCRKSRTGTDRLDWSSRSFDGQTNPNISLTSLTGSCWRCAGESKKDLCKIWSWSWKDCISIQAKQWRRRADPS